jgi:F0F1-type ATP synthase membrane subunit b/b'
MLKVQRFADETAEEAQRQARAIVADAQLEAASIVSRARREAEEVTATAVPQISPEAVATLCSAIEGFAETNRVLVDELAQLRDALTGSYADTPISSHGHLSAVPPTAS